MRMRNRVLGTAACLGLALIAYPIVLWVGATAPDPGRVAGELDAATPQVEAPYRQAPTRPPVTTDVEPHLQLQGRADPSESRLLRAGGDLTFEGEWTPDEARQIIATTVQAPGEDRPPRVECDLPFLAFDLVNVDEKTSTDPAVAYRNYTYRARFVPGPPPGRFAGTARVFDPWDESRTRVVAIHGRTPEPIQVIPPRLILGVGATEDGPGAEAILRLRVRNPALAPTVAPEAPAASPLAVRPVDAGEEGVLAFVVEIRSQAGTIEAGVQHLVVRPSADSSEEIVVPVMIREEDRP